MTTSPGASWTWGAGDRSLLAVMDAGPAIGAGTLWWAGMGPGVGAEGKAGAERVLGPALTAPASVRSCPQFTQNFVLAGSGAGDGAADGGRGQGGAVFDHDGGTGLIPQRAALDGA